MTCQKLNKKSSMLVVNNKDSKAVIKTKSSVDNGAIKINLESLYIKLGIIKEKKNRF